MRDLQDSNNLASFQMDQRGFDGIMSHARLEVVPDTKPITINHSQAQVKALAKAKTRGAKFIATGGGYVTLNDVFKAMNMSTRGNDIKDMEDEKKSFKKLMEVEDKDIEALVCVGSQYEQLKAANLVNILR